MKSNIDFIHEINDTNSSFLNCGDLVKYPIQKSLSQMEKSNYDEKDCTQHYEEEEEEEEDRQLLIPGASKLISLFDTHPKQTTSSTVSEKKISSQNNTNYTYFDPLHARNDTEMEINEQTSLLQRTTHAVNSNQSSLFPNILHSLQSFCSTTNETTKESIFVTLIGSVTYLLFHIVFCLAQASAIPRPHSSHKSIMDVMLKIAALGPILSGPLFIYAIGGMNGGLPALYPSLDLFSVPFLSQLAIIVDSMLADIGLENDDDMFYTTFCVLGGLGMIFSGLLNILSTHFQSANLGAFLPYPVMCGFFSAVGLMVWVLSFSVDTSGENVWMILRVHDNIRMKYCFLHHIPSLIIGFCLYFAGKRNRLVIPFLSVGTILISHIVLYSSGISMSDAVNHGWFWDKNDFKIPVKVQDIRLVPPLPFGVLIGIFRGKAFWPAVMKGLPVSLAMGFIYFIRCSLHAPALKKNASFLQKWSTEQDRLKNNTQIPISLENEEDHFSAGELSDGDGDFSNWHLSVIHRKGKENKPISTSTIILWYGRGLVLSGLAGGSVCLPSMGSAAALYKLGAKGRAPQVGSVILLFSLYMTGFKLVHYVPKVTLSSLLIVTSVDLMETWFLGSYKKIVNKEEWFIIPFIVLSTFVIGLLPAVFFGVALSTCVFVASFYRTGIFKYVSSGLSLRSTIERNARDLEWLDQNGDLIQIIVLQNYLFFGNVASCSSYISTLFEEAPLFQSMKGKCVPRPRHLIIDFTLVTGMDASAVDIFSEILTLCKDYSCTVYMTGLCQILKSTLLCGKVVHSSRSISFAPRLRFLSDMDTALGVAEDKLLRSVFKLEETDFSRCKNFSNASLDGFTYTLRLIDVQHGVYYASALCELQPYTDIIELKVGEHLFPYPENINRLGLYFIERGIIKVEKTPLTGTVRGCKCRLPFGRHALGEPQQAEFQLNPSGLLKKSHRIHRNTFLHPTSVHLARLGPGWVIGMHEYCSQLDHQGVYVAVTKCTLHHLPLAAIETLEGSNPSLILKLYKMMSCLSARRQDSTIQHLSMLNSVMSSVASNEPKPMEKTILSTFQNF